MISADMAPIRETLSLAEMGCQSGADAGRYKAAVDYARTMYDKDLSRYVENMERISFTGGRTVLDVGSGSGHWCLALAQNNGLVVGIDVNEEYCRIARLVASNFVNGHRTVFARGSAEDIPYPARYFDYLVCHGVLMFCNHDISLSGFNRALRPGGKLYLGYSGLGWYLNYLIADGIVGHDQNRVAKGFTVLSDSFKFQAGFRHADRLWLTMSSDAMTRLLQANGFECESRPGIQDGIKEFLGFEATYDMVAKRVSDSRQLAPEIEALLQRDPGSIAGEVMHQIGIGNPQRAILILDAAEEIAVGLSDARLLRCRALTKAGRLEEAGEHITGVPGNSPSACYAKAIHAHAGHDYNGALAHYPNAVGDDDDLTVKYLMAECHRESGRLTEAEHLFQEVLDQDGRHLPAWVGMLGTVCARGDKAAIKRWTTDFLLTRYEEVEQKGTIDDLLARLGPEKQAPTALAGQSTGEESLAGKRILHAPFEIAGNMARIARLLRQENIDTTSANYYDSWLNYQCDINLKVNSLPEKERLSAIDTFARQAVDKYDIFHFHFAQSLYPDLRDLEGLRQKGKSIIFSFWGSDRRGPEWIFYHQAKFLGHKPPKPYFLTRQLYQAHKTINRYADVMLGATCIPRGIWIRGHADTSAWNLGDKQRIIEKNLIKKDPAKTYFVHAPSNNMKKGSGMIIRLLKECQDEGMPVELLYVAQMSPEKAREIYAYADFAIDQVGVGTLGLFGVEMFCWEIPVIVYNSDLMNRLRNYPPVIHITKESFTHQIARCIEMKRTGESRQLGKKGRQWAIDNEDVSLAIPEYLQIYRDLAEGKQIPQYVNRSWYEEEHRMQSGVKSEFYRYMIEQNVFTEIGVEVSGYDRQLYY